jgi:hypothetical protein
MMFPTLQNAEGQALVLLNFAQLPLLNKELDPIAFTMNGSITRHTELFAFTVMGYLAQR